MPLDHRPADATAAPTCRTGIEAQADSLGRLSWMFLRLLVARRTIVTVLGERRERRGAREDGGGARAPGAATSRWPPDLRRSLKGQIEILGQRIEQRDEAQRKLAYIDAELTRIEQQVELIREQAALSTDPEVLSQRIDEIAATLGGTAQWIRDQQQVYGAMEDLLTEPPPLDRRRPREGEPMTELPALGDGDARPVPLGIGRAVPAPRQRLRRRAGRTAACSRCRRSSTR